MFSIVIVNFYIVVGILVLMENWSTQACIMYIAYFIDIECFFYVCLLSCFAFTLLCCSVCFFRINLCQFVLKIFWMFCVHFVLCCSHMYLQ